MPARCMLLEGGFREIVEPQLSDLRFGFSKGRGCTDAFSLLGKCGEEFGVELSGWWKDQDRWSNKADPKVRQMMNIPPDLQVNMRTKFKIIVIKGSVLYPLDTQK